MTDKTQPGAEADSRATALDLDKLEALACAATPGEWFAKKFGSIEAGPLKQYVNGRARDQIASFMPADWMPDGQREANTEFAVAARPEVVLALIAQARRATAPHASTELRTVALEAAQVLESAAAHNRSKNRTVLAHSQQDRADRLRLALADQPDELRKSVRNMARMLEENEWAEQLLRDPDAVALENEITRLVGLYNAQRAAQPVEAAGEKDELHFNATRLRNVARLVGLENAIPQDDATLDGARGSVLGLIAGTLRNAATQPASQACTVPPAGWECTRAAGHQGPCAAIPSDDSHSLEQEAIYQRGVEDGKLIARGMARLKAGLASQACGDQVAVPDPDADIAVPGWDFPTTYADIARIPPEKLWNRYVCARPWPNAKAAFLMARALPFAVRHVIAAPATGVQVAKVDKFEEIRALLNETHQFASTSPVGQQNISAALDLLDEIESAAAPADLTDAARDVLAERRRQVEQEGWTVERDDRYRDCELARAAAVYAVCQKPGQMEVCGVKPWPWPMNWWKPGSYRRNLEKAGALIIAEIERLDRAQPTTQAEGK